MSSRWPQIENETLGITHAFHRDGRSRGEAIVCDEVTGCGHSLWGWDFYRETYVLYGSVAVNGSVVVNPVPSSLRWRPDRVTATYHVLNATIQEQKFFTPQGAFLSIISIISLPQSYTGPVELQFSGHSYVNTKSIPTKDPSSAGIPPNTPRSVERNSSVRLVDGFGPCGASKSQCEAVEVLERGTGYAKPIDCSFAPFPPGVDCKAKVGPMMYDNMTVVIAASQNFSSSLKLGADDERRQWYNFSLLVTAAKPVVVGWHQGDDALQTKAELASLMSVTAATAALAARTAEANTFLNTHVPQLNMSRGAKVVPLQDSLTWDVKSGFTCVHTIPHFKFISNPSSLAICEDTCGADDNCQQFVYKTDGAWCALYNVSGEPLPNALYDCVCRESCPFPPGPPAPGPLPPAPPPRGINDAYWFGWAFFWMMGLNSEREPFETVRHSQSAPNNFLGLHLHDTQYYLNVGAWVDPTSHPEYAHGNILMWDHARRSEMVTTSPYWSSRLARGLLPDNMGSSWVASSTCDQLVELVEGAANIYAKGDNKTFLRIAYNLFRDSLTNGTIGQEHILNWVGSAKSLNAMVHLTAMAEALGEHSDAAAWAALFNASTPHFSENWGRCGVRWGCDDGINAQGAIAAPAPFYRDEWADAFAEEWLLNDVYGYYPPNRTYGAPLLSVPLNVTYAGPWLSHTTYTAEVFDGLFRHHAEVPAINLTLEHIGAMQRDYGYTVFPEAWDRDGGLWGDQWYLWGVPVAVLLPLERLAGVTLTRVDTLSGANSPGILTVCDRLPYPEYETAHVRIPNGGGWIDVRVTQSDPNTKTIVVTGNTMGALMLQPWLGPGRQLVSASPSGFLVDNPRGHVSWQFLGDAAFNASVRIVTRPTQSPP